jgi:hypothetical protein
MKIYLVERIDGCGWDEYDSAVVVAESIEDAIALVLEDNELGRSFRLSGIDNIDANEISLTRGVVLGSFNAG